MGECARGGKDLFPSMIFLQQREDNDTSLSNSALQYSRSLSRDAIIQLPYNTNNKEEPLSVVTKGYQLHYKITQ